MSVHANTKSIRAFIVAAISLSLFAATGTAAQAEEPSSFTSTPTATLSGTAAVGQTLTVTYGDTDPASDSHVVTWWQSETIVGTGDTYEVEPDEVGLGLYAVITFSKAGFADGTSVSDPSANVVKGTQSFTPVISGYAATGSTLSVPGLPAGATYTYQWKRNGSSISGAKSSTYKQTSSDLGKKISVTVTATRAGYTTLAKTSAATATVKKGFTKTYAPKITGTAKVGSTLKATTTAWSPAATLKYQWYRDGVAISGATSTSRKIASSDEGKSFTVKVTGSKSGYFTRSYTSAATAIVGKGTISAATPKITGTAKAGYTLTVTVGTVTPSTATKTIQWYRNGVAVAGKTGSTYKLYNVDAHKKITVKVTYTLTGFTTKVVTSAATASVSPRSSSMANNKEYAPAHPTSTYPDLAAGIYIADNATADCEWVRDTDHNATNGEIAYYYGAARWMVQVYDTDGAFWSNACGSWVKYDGTGAQATTITKDGMYRIGVDILPGVYQQSGAIDSCFVTLEANASNEDSAIVDGGSPSAGATITIDGNTAPYFTTWRCGTWTWVGEVPAVG